MPSNLVAMPSLFLNSTQKGRDVRTLSLNLNRGLFFPEVERIYCQVTQAVIPYSMINISGPLYDNNCFTVLVQIPGSTPVNIELDEGVYPSITELEQAMNFKIHEMLVTAGFANGGFIIDDPSTYYVRLEPNTTTNKIFVYIPNLVPTGLTPPNPTVQPNTVTNIFTTCQPNGSSKLFQELGFPRDHSLGQGDDPPEIITNTSTEPITFLDILASGVYIVCEDDLQVLSYFDELANSNVLAQVPLTNDDLVGGQILYPRDLQVIACPLTEGKSVKQFKIRLISPKDPTRDIVFLQGDFSCVLSFHAIY